jgi:uncharacterized protein YbjQ (UPF0145 family)
MQPSSASPSATSCAQRERVAPGHLPDPTEGTTHDTQLATQTMTSTTFDIPGHAVDQTLGLSWGLVVRSVGLAKGLTGGLRSIRAGEVDEYTDVVGGARHVALQRLVANALALGGNAVLGVRFDSSDMGNGLAEIVAYGTAATVRPV